MKVIIAGGRDFTNYVKLERICDYYLQNTDNIEIVSGNARGTDILGEKYAEKRNYKLKIFPADWDKYGKSAGYIRNNEMAKYGDALIAFWDGTSRGTENMIEQAKKNDLKIRIVKY